MKRFLSWVVLCILSTIASIILGLVSVVLVLIYNWLISLNGILRIIMQWIIYCCIGSIHIILPAILSMYVISICEKITASKKGIRYIVCGAYAILCLILQKIDSGSITLAYTMFAVYGAVMIIQAIKKK